jgi:hypothetical protein
MFLTHVPWPHPYSHCLLCTRPQILLNDTMSHSPTHIIVVRNIIRSNPLHFSLTLKMETYVSKRSGYCKHYPAIQPKITPLHTTHEKHSIAFRPGINSYWFFPFKYMTCIHIYNEVLAMYSAIETWWHKPARESGVQGETGEWSGYPANEKRQVTACTALLPCYYYDVYTSPASA